MECAIPAGNDWSGVRLEVAFESGQPQVTLPAQAAFFDPVTEDWVHGTRDEIGAVLAANPSFGKGNIRIYAASLAESEGIVTTLAEHGVTFRKSGDLPPPPALLGAPDMLVEITFTITKGIRRCVAKYALNYLASVCGRSFVAGRDFDAIRAFVRYGTAWSEDLVVESFRPILWDDRPGVRQSQGHLLSLSWDHSGRVLLGQVSLFNHVTYEVRLCKDFRGPVWIPIRSGLHFDVTRKVVHPLLAFSK